MDSPIGAAFLKQFKVTNVVAGRGHDTGGLICDLHLGSKKIALYNDNGWGGGADITFLKPEYEQQMTQMLKDVKYQQLMFDTGWDFLDKPEDIGLHSAIEDVVSLVTQRKQQDKALKQLDKATLTALVVGTSVDSYTEYFWNYQRGGRAPLNKIGKAALQKKYDNLRKKLKKDEKILNSVEQLASLEVNI